MLGDVNEELEDVPGFPTRFTSLPAGLPSSWWLGSDLYDELVTEGLDNDPFAPLLALVSSVDAFQLDGDDATRATSTRRIDHVFVSPAAAAGAAGQVYDSRDEGLAGGLPLSGAALASSTSEDASDHLVVFADLQLADGAPTISGLSAVLGADLEVSFTTEVSAMARVCTNAGTCVLSGPDTTHVVTVPAAGDLFGVIARDADGDVDISGPHPF